MSVNTAGISVPTDSASQADAAYRKIYWRIIPFLMLCYLIAFVDRSNIGFAKLQFVKDLGFTETVYGFGAGIFYLGYILLEVPSNLFLEKIGVRKNAPSDHGGMGPLRRDDRIHHCRLAPVHSAIFARRRRSWVLPGRLVLSDPVDTCEASGPAHRHVHGLHRRIRHYRRPFIGGNYDTSAGRVGVSQAGSGCSSRRACLPSC